MAEHSHEAGMAGESALLLFWWRVNWKCVQAAVSASVGWGRALRNAPRTPFPLPEVLSPVCVSSVPCWKMLKMLLEGEPSRAASLLGKPPLTVEAGTMWRPSFQSFQRRFHPPVEAAPHRADCPALPCPARSVPCG